MCGCCESREFGKKLSANKNFFYNFGDPNLIEEEKLQEGVQFTYESKEEESLEQESSSWAEIPSEI